MLDNFSQAEKVLKTIAEDEGTALRNNEAKLNSVEGRIMKLNNATQELYVDIFNSDMVKEFISALTQVVHLIDDLVKHTGALTPLMGILGAATTVKGGGQLNQSSYPKWMKSYKAPGIVRGNTKQVHAF